MILDGKRLSESERLKLAADDEYAADDLINEPWFQARLKQQRLDVDRNAQRSVASVLAEYRARGFAGYTVSRVDGELTIEGVAYDCDEGMVPSYLREDVA